MSVSIGSQSPDIVQGVNSAVKLCEGNSERIPTRRTLAAKA